MSNDVDAVRQDIEKQKVLEEAGKQEEYSWGASLSNMHVPIKRSKLGDMKKIFAEEKYVRDI